MFKNVFGPSNLNYSEFSGCPPSGSPGYEGQLKGMAEPISHPVSALVRTHNFSSLKVCGRTSGDG